jgi:16S rRNA U516 pseudouridylate synthase RsuA-like enzyme
MSDIEPREIALQEFNEEYPDKLRQGIQYSDKEFDHAVLRTWKNGTTSVARLNKKKTAWVFVRFATEDDIRRVKRMLDAKKNAVSLLGDK